MFSWAMTVVTVIVFFSDAVTPRSCRVLTKQRPRVPRISNSMTFLQTSSSLNMSQINFQICLNCSEALIFAKNYIYIKLLYMGPSSQKFN